MSAPPGWRQGQTALLVKRAYWRFQEIYMSVIWGVAIPFLMMFFYWWAQGKGWLPRSHAIRRVEGKVVAGACALGFLLSCYRYAKPDWVIGHRLRRAAAALRLALEANANDEALDWIWACYDESQLQLAAPTSPYAGTRMPFSMDSTSTLLVGDRCWTLCSASDPARLLFVSHTPKATAGGGALSSGGAGSRTLELVSVMFFGRASIDRTPLPEATRERLTALGFRVVKSADGLWVHKTRVNGFGRKLAAMNQVQTNEIVELWKLCTRAG